MSGTRLKLPYIGIVVSVGSNHDEIRENGPGWVEEVGAQDAPPSLVCSGGAGGSWRNRSKVDAMLLFVISTVRIK
eukprot:2782445-Amphidinium_carterae.1